MRNTNNRSDDLGRDSRDSRDSLDSRDSNKNRKSHSGRRRSNRGILGMIYFFAIVFFAMAGYMGYFIAVKAPDLMSNPYNSRMDVFNSRYVRGSIKSSDGEILAKTDVDEDGNETRVYPKGEVFAHAIGYSTKGKTGLESASNFYLMASNINPVGKIYNELLEEKSQGDTVVTTLDSKLQSIAFNALGDNDGAVIAMDPKTGKVLCMVSKPSYNPNKVVENWEELISEDNTSGQLVNRATQGLYPPGSTFKIVMALEYMREHPNYEKYTYDCTGEYQDPADDEYVVHCFDGEVHGEETLQQAFANSCNAAFAQIGTEIDKTKLKKTSSELLFNESLPIITASSKSRFQLSDKANEWTMMQTAIGQGTTMMSPLHSLLITSAIANDGVLQAPLLIDRVESADGRTVKTMSSASEKKLMTSKEADTLKDFMRDVVAEGTASRLRTDDYKACGKTGSAEQSSADGKMSTVAWFTGFAPMDDPEIAVCVVVEDGETGGRTAVPIAKKVMDYWLVERN